MKIGEILAEGILTKENFWNELMEHYPSEMDRFCKWIDEYKKRVEWEYLISSDPHIPAGPLNDRKALKYHQIPIAMQVGIFLQFRWEQQADDSNDFLIRSFRDMIDQFILDWFKLAADFRRREQSETETPEIE